jgi:hypothetical protein
MFRARVHVSTHTKKKYSGKGRLFILSGAWHISRINFNDSSLHQRGRVDERKGVDDRKISYAQVSPKQIKKKEKNWKNWDACEFRKKKST